MTTQALADALGLTLLGNGKIELNSVASLRTAKAHDLIFVESAASLPEALASSAGAVLAGEFAKEAKSKKPLLIAEQPRLAFARAAQILIAEPETRRGIHPNAVVDKSATLGKNIGIAAHVVIGAGCDIGDGCIIAANSFIGAGVRLGRECRIGPNVTIYPGCTLGERVEVQAGTVLGSAGFGYVRDAKTGRYHHFPQIGSLRIEDDVEIGANVTIDRGALEETVIGRGTKIDNLVHIAHNVRIGKNVVIAALTGISGSSVIEDNVIIGGQVGIGDHALVKEGVILGSGSGVLTKKIVRGKGVVFWGRPAKPLKQYLKELAALGKLSKK
jgi:UDP-3-O-[3-hydroxymyristoyl] glucosamine N-acyltransferase